MKGDYSTHGYGLKCAVCKAVLIPDDCCPGNPHGYTFQEPGDWAARTWPEHACLDPDAARGERGAGR